MTSMRARAIDVAAAAFREAGVRAPRTQASTAVDALLAAGLLHDPDVNVDRIERALAFAEAARSATDEARIERAARDLLMDALGAIYDLGGCDGTCGTTGQCVAKRIRAYLADDQEDTDA